MFVYILSSKQFCMYVHVHQGKELLPLTNFCLRACNTVLNLYGTTVEGQLDDLSDRICKGQISEG